MRRLRPDDGGAGVAEAPAEVRGEEEMKHWRPKTHIAKPGQKLGYDYDGPLKTNGMPVKFRGSFETLCQKRAPIEHLTTERPTCDICNREAKKS